MKTREMEPQSQIPPINPRYVSTWRTTHCLGTSLAAHLDPSEFVPGIPNPSCTGLDQAFTSVAYSSSTKVGRLSAPFTRNPPPNSAAQPLPQAFQCFKGAPLHLHLENLNQTSLRVLRSSMHGGIPAEWCQMLICAGFAHGR